jgi:hypothetical protein
MLILTTNEIYKGLMMITQKIGLSRLCSSTDSAMSGLRAWRHAELDTYVFDAQPHSMESASEAEQLLKPNQRASR